MPKQARRSGQFADCLREDVEDRQKQFSDKMKYFPCSFNLGCSDLNIGETPYRGFGITEPDLGKYNFEYLKQNLENAIGKDYEDIIWRQNLLTRVLAELDFLPAALKMNEAIRRRSCNKNLVALGNAVFLYNLNNDSKQKDSVLCDLNELKTTVAYKDLKVRAILEQAYEYRKFGGAKHLLCSMALFNFALPMCPTDERLEFMRAMVYRRCTHFGIYLEDPQNINRQRFALQAAQELFRLGNEAKENAIKSAALIELAYLKHGDDTYGQSARYKNHEPLLDSRVWSNIVGRYTWKELCFNALDTGGGNLTERVLKIAGQLLRYFGSKEDLVKSEMILLHVINTNPINRAHHHLGLTYRKMAINFERDNGYQKQQRPTTRNENDIKTIPRPPENKRPQTLDEQLKCLLKVPRNKLLPFNARNPYTYKAVRQFTEAIKLSHNLNIPAHYDLAMMYAQMGMFGKAKNQLISLIEVCSKCFGQQRKTYIVSAFNLHAVCSAMEAEKTEDHIKKKALAAESEEMLIKTVRMASYLAADIPELAMAATDLWNAFSTLESQFQFEGSDNSKKKLFELCELIADYRYLEEIDKIISRDNSEWLNVEALERCLECYQNLGDIDGALLFLDMISIRPETNNRFSKLNSPSVRLLMFEVAKRTLTRSLTQTQDDDALPLPDQMWKQMVHESCDAFHNPKQYDIVIVQDTGDDYEPDSGTRCDNTCRYLKDILERTCGLNVVRHHEEGLPGGLYLDQCIDTISKSHVVIFVLASPKTPSLESRLETVLTLNEQAHETVALCVDSETGSPQVPRQTYSVSSRDPTRTETTVQQNLTKNPDIEAPISSTFNYIISTCTKRHLERKKPAHIVSICLGEMQHDDLPILLDFPNLHFSDVDINTLSSALQDCVYDETINLIMTVFKAVINMG